jgi:hypothetical protein
MELLNPLNDPQFTARSQTYTGTAGTVASWPSGPQGVLVWATTDAYIRVSTDAVVAATTADTPIPAGVAVPFKVPRTGVAWQVSAVQITAGGTVYAKPIAAE